MTVLYGYDMDWCPDWYRDAWQKGNVYLTSAPLYKPQSRQSAKLFLQSSEMGLPQPLTRRRVCPPPPVLGGGAHSLTREGLGESQFRWGDIHCGTLYITYFVLQTLATILNFHKNCYVENIPILQYTYCDFSKIFMTVWTTEDWEHPERYYFLLLKKTLCKKLNQRLIMQYV